MTRPTDAEVIAALARAKAAFQLRTVEAILRQRPTALTAQETTDDRA